MAETSFKKLPEVLSSLKTAAPSERPQAFLLHGEELLYKRALAQLLDALLPGGERARTAGCEPVDGGSEAIRDAVNRANTYALMPGAKVVLVQESRIFYGKENDGRLLEKVRDAAQGGDFKKASRWFMDLLGRRQMSLEDMSHEKGRTAVFPDMDTGGNTDWLGQLVDHCRSAGLTVSSSGRPDQILQAAIEKGFPANNFLVLTTDLVDKRRTLFKCFKDKGVVIDCAVPKGDRKADRDIQQQVLKERMGAMLKAAGKKMDPDAFAALYEMTGFDLRAFCGNVEKLVLYAGDRTTITAKDVGAVLSRSRQDPVYAFTGALTDRKMEEALVLLDAVLRAGLHPLQVFTAAVNQFRKLMVVKCFLRSPEGGCWKSAMAYNAFTAVVLPAMVRYDDGMRAAAEKEKLDGARKKGKRQVQEDLLTAANPRNPYPLYLTLKKADQFSLEELEAIYLHLGDMDLALKRSARPAKRVLEDMILFVCRPRLVAPTEGRRYA